MDFRHFCGFNLLRQNAATSTNFGGRFECQPSILEIVDVTTGFEQFFGPRSGRDLFSPAYLYVYIYIYKSHPKNEGFQQPRLRLSASGWS